ncbi:putative copper homeostasis (lipo)protein LpqS [Mycobacterium ostraviense]
MGYWQAWVRAAAWCSAARGRPHLRSLVAVVSAVGMLAIAAHSDLLRPISHNSHPAHALVSSLGSEFATTLDHPHVDNGSAGTHHAAFPTAMLTKSSSTALVALSLVSALVVVAGSLVRRAVPAGRGPPGGLAAALTGQDLLTRFCLSRR